MGTLAGSLVISGAAGNVLLVLIGAAAAAAGVLPVIAGGAWTTRDQSREDLYEARERKVVQYAASRLQDLASLSRQPRAERVIGMETAISESVGHLLDEIYGADAELRVVVYGLSEDGSSLTVLHEEGRSDPANVVVRNSTRGESVFALIEGAEEFELQQEILDDRGYRSFVAVPIRSTDEAYGMLSLDHTSPSGVERRDGDLLTVLASMLSVYFAEAKRGKHGKSDTVNEDKGGI
ncbi:GAF domain-containing protein [Arthrobacter sp. D2-10]